MKSQFSTQPAILSEPSLVIDRSKILKIQKITCLNNNQANYICINSNCVYENAIMCSDVKCSCRMMHECCIRAQTQSIILAIESHSRPLKQFQQKVNDMFQKTIDHLSVIRDDLIQRHRQLFQQKSYSQKESLFLKMLENDSLKEIKGKLMSQIVSKINIRQETNKLITDSDQQLQKILTKMTNNVQSLSSQVQKVLIQLQRNFNNEKSAKNILIKSPFLFENSQIITTNDQQDILKTFFQETILESTLLYRASQHNFSGEMFHKLCEDISNILVLVKTQHGKLIGGYTPLSFSSSQHELYIKDPSLKSFIFSLTQGDKLKLKNPQNAIMNERKQSDYVLRFGGGSDLRISNQANQNSRSYAGILNSYINQKYTANSQFYRKFSGNQSIYFKITQWEVWEVKF